MKVVYSERVKTTLNTLSDDDREKLYTWFQYLQNWDRDPFAQAQSVQLSVDGKTVYLFRTSTDVRIFYTVDQEKQTITIIAVTEKETIMAFGNSGGKM